MHHARSQHCTFLKPLTDKGVPSHHAVTKDGGTGNLLVNSKDHGSYQTIQRLVAALELGVSTPDWPVRLTNPITSSKDGTLATTDPVPAVTTVTAVAAVAAVAESGSANPAVPRTPMMPLLVTPPPNRFAQSPTRARGKPAKLTNLFSGYSSTSAGSSAQIGAMRTEEDAAAPGGNQCNQRNACNQSRVQGGNHEFQKFQLKQTNSAHAKRDAATLLAPVANLAIQTTSSPSPKRRASIVSMHPVMFVGGQRWIHDDNLAGDCC